MLWRNRSEKKSDSRSDKRGTWLQSLTSFAGSILFVLAVRWALFEPYVIPSGSMIPTLQIRDHILVNKFAYGVRLPFSNIHLIRFGVPERGEVIVFRSVSDSDTFVVKRVVGLPGDKLSIQNGRVSVNGKKVDVELSILKTGQGKVDLLNAPGAISYETLDQVRHMVVFTQDEEGEPETYEVPEGELFMMGDNRDYSADSREWGTLPIERVLGRASLIWLSCEEPLAGTNQLCNPDTVRWDRMFQGIQ